MDQTPINSADANPGSLKSCATGFILSIVLTALAFAMVMPVAGLSRRAVFIGISGAAFVQILVHLHYFLHLDASSETRWNRLALVFTVLILMLFAGGTLWIMSNLNDRMM